VTQPPGQSSGAGPKRASGTEDRRSGQAAGLGGTAPMLHRAAPEDLATGEGILGRVPAPGAAGGVSGPRAHGSAALGQHGLRPGIAAALHGHAVHARNAQEGRTCVDFRRSLTVRVGLPPGGRGASGSTGAAAASSQRGGIPAQVRSLCASPAQRCGGRHPTGPGRSPRQPLATERGAGPRGGGRGARAGAHSAEEPLSGGACDRAECLRQLAMPWQERRRHGEHLRGALLKAWGAMTQEGDDFRCQGSGATC
jgi:hypothetical protein